jgi:hypothetical protein
MPAKDHYHHAVIQALENAGWTITAEQVGIVLEERRLWIDIRAMNQERNLAILVEVKGFENMPSPVDYLAHSIGKYVLYRSVLHFLDISTPLYMAVPVAAYNGILSEVIGQQTVTQSDVKLIVFDPVSEEIIEWIPQP